MQASHVVEPVPKTDSDVTCLEGGSTVEIVIAVHFTPYFLSCNRAQQSNALSTGVRRHNLKNTYSLRVQQNKNEYDVMKGGNRN